MTKTEIIECVASRLSSKRPTLSKQCVSDVIDTFLDIVTMAV